jgi:hypothetical protein
MARGGCKKNYIFCLVAVCENVNKMLENILSIP